MIAPESDDSYTLLRVLQHDDAYAWARRRRASVNQATGAIELRDVVAIEDELPDLLTAGSASAPPLLAGISDADLARLGVDEEVRPFARGLTDISQLWCSA